MGALKLERGLESGSYVGKKAREGVNLPEDGGKTSSSSS